MEIVRHALSIKLGKGLYLEQGKPYLVHSVSYSKLAGVLFELVGFAVEGREHFHRLPADQFRALNGKRAGVVQAYPGTDAFRKFDKKLLYLSGLVIYEGNELVRCREYKWPVEHLLAMPYNQFEHV